MSASTLAAPLTARALLFGTGVPQGGTTELGRALEESHAAQTALHGVRRLGSSALHAVNEEIGTVANGLLDIDLGDALVSGWRKYTALTEAGHRTLRSAGAEEVVALATHRITATFRPSVDLLVNDLRVNSFEFELSVVFDLTGLAAVVRAGNLVALRGGECVVTGSLRLEGALLAERRRRLDVSILVPLRSEVSLVDQPMVRVPRQVGRGEGRPDGHREQAASPRHRAARQG